jgi:hypothetical protein
MVNAIPSPSHSAGMAAWLGGTMQMILGSPLSSADVHDSFPSKDISRERYENNVETKAVERGLSDGNKSYESLFVDRKRSKEFRNHHKNDALFMSPNLSRPMKEQPPQDLHPNIYSKYPLYYDNEEDSTYSSNTLESSHIFGDRIPLSDPQLIPKTQSPSIVNLKMAKMMYKS